MYLGYLFSFLFELTALATFSQILSPGTRGHEEGPHTLVSSLRHCKINGSDGFNTQMHLRNGSTHLCIWFRLPHDLLPQLADLARDDHGAVGIVWVTGIEFR